MFTNLLIHVLMVLVPTATPISLSPSVKIKLLNKGDFVPDGLLQLSVDVDGSVWDLSGREVPEPDFLPLLIELGNPSRILLVVRDVKNTPIGVVSTVLFRFMMAAPTTNEIIIYCFFTPISLKE